MGCFENSIKRDVYDSRLWKIFGDRARPFLGGMDFFGIDLGINMLGAAGALNAYPEPRKRHGHNWTNNAEKRPRSIA